VGICAGFRCSVARWRSDRHRTDGIRQDCLLPVTTTDAQRTRCSGTTAGGVTFGAYESTWVTVEGGQTTAPFATLDDGETDAFAVTVSSAPICTGTES
jgi:hypothetical protein